MMINLRRKHDVETETECMNNTSEQKYYSIIRSSLAFHLYSAVAKTVFCIVVVIMSNFANDYKKKGRKSKQKAGGRKQTVSVTCEIEETPESPIAPENIIADPHEVPILISECSANLDVEKNCKVLISPLKDEISFKQIPLMSQQGVSAPEIPKRDHAILKKEEHPMKIEVPIRRNLRYYANPRGPQLPWLKEIQNRIDNDEVWLSSYKISVKFNIFPRDYMCAACSYLIYSCRYYWLQGKIS